MERQQILNRIDAEGLLPNLSPELSLLFRKISAPNWQNDASGVETLLQSSGFADSYWQYIRSPFFAYPVDMESLSDLLDLIDQQTVGALLIEFLLRQVLPQQYRQTTNFDRRKHRRHTLGTAVAARIIATRTKISQPDRVFAYGMIHDLGVTVLDSCLPDLLDEVCHVRAKGSRQIVAEQVILYGLTHEDLGGWLCEKWKLPLAVKSVVKYHHRPLLATSGVDEAKLLYLADMLSAEKFVGLIGHGLPRKIEATVRGHLGITASGLAAVERELPILVDEAVQLLE